MGDAADIVPNPDLAENEEERAELAAHHDHIETLVMNLLDRREIIGNRQTAAEELRQLVRRRNRLADETYEHIADGVMKCLNSRVETPLLIQTLLHVIATLLADTQKNCHRFVRRGIIISLTTRSSSEFRSPTGIRVQCTVGLGILAECCKNCCKDVVNTSFQTIMHNLPTVPVNALQMSIFVRAIHAMFNSSLANPTVDIPTYFVKALMDAYSKHNNHDIRGHVVYSMMQWLSTNATPKNASIVIAYPNILKKLVEFAKYARGEEVVCVFRILGHLIYANDDCTQPIFETGIIDVVRDKMWKYSIRSKVECFWFLSNLLAIRNPRILSHFMEKTPELWNAILRSSYAHCPRLRREAFFCIFNVVSALDEQKLNFAMHAYFGRMIFDILDDFLPFTSKQGLFIEKTLLTFLFERLSCYSLAVYVAATELKFADAIRFKVDKYVAYYKEEVVTEATEISGMLDVVKIGDKCLSVLNKLDRQSALAGKGPNGDAEMMEVDEPETLKEIAEMARLIEPDFSI